MSRSVRRTACRHAAGLGSVVLLMTAGLNAQPAPQTHPSSQPATQPSPDTVLIRFENSPQAVTQGEFDSYFYNGPPVDFEREKDKLMRELVERKLFLIHMDDHPDLVTEQEIDAAIEKARKEINARPGGDFDAFLKRAGLTLEAYRLRWRVEMGRTALLAVGQKRAETDEQLRKAFEEHPDHYDGTQLKARHIARIVAPYAPPEEWKAQREKAEQIRQDLVSGRTTWNEAVKQSQYPDRLSGGDLGFFYRHRSIQEPIAAAAFEMEVRQISEVVQSVLGYHVIEVISRVPGKRSFEESKNDVRRWLQWEVLHEASGEARRKHPPIGVRPPEKPAPRATAPAELPPERPSPATRPRR